MPSHLRVAAAAILMALMAPESLGVLSTPKPSSTAAKSRGSVRRSAPAGVKSGIVRTTRTSPGGQRAFGAAGSGPASLFDAFTGSSNGATAKSVRASSAIAQAYSTSISKPQQQRKRASLARKPASGARPLGPRGGASSRAQKSARRAQFMQRRAASQKGAPASSASSVVEPLRAFLSGAFIAPPVPSVPRPKDPVDAAATAAALAIVAVRNAGSAAQGLTAGAVSSYETTAQEAARYNLTLPNLPGPVLAIAASAPAPAAPTAEPSSPPRAAASADSPPAFTASASGTTAVPSSAPVGKQQVQPAPPQPSETAPAERKAMTRRVALAVGTAAVLAKPVSMLVDTLRLPSASSRFAAADSALRVADKVALSAAKTAASASSAAAHLYKSEVASLKGLADGTMAAAASVKGARDLDIACRTAAARLAGEKSRLATQAGQYFEQARNARVASDATALYGKAEDTTEALRQAARLEEDFRRLFAAFERAVGTLAAAQADGQAAVTYAEASIDHVVRAASLAQEAAEACATDASFRLPQRTAFDSATAQAREARAAYERCAAKAKASSERLGKAAELAATDVLARLRSSPALVSRLNDLRIPQSLDALAKSSAKASKAFTAVSRAESTVNLQATELERKVAETAAAYSALEREYTSARRLFADARNVGSLERRRVEQLSKDLLRDQPLPMPRAPQVPDMPPPRMPREFAPPPRVTGPSAPLTPSTTPQPLPATSWQQ